MYNIWQSLRRRRVMVIGSEVPWVQPHLLLVRFHPVVRIDNRGAVVHMKLDSTRRHVSTNFLLHLTLPFAAFSEPDLDCT